MKVKKYGFRFLLSLFIFLIFILGAAYSCFGIIPWTSFVAQEPLSLNYNSRISPTIIGFAPFKNLRQTPYDCGAFNIYAVLNGFGVKEPLTEVIKANREKMIPRLGVVPEVLVSTFKKYGISSEIKTFRWQTADQKTETLKINNIY